MAHWLSQLNPIWMFPITIFGFALLAGIADLIGKQLDIDEHNRDRRRRRHGS